MKINAWIQMGCERREVIFDVSEAEIERVDVSFQSTREREPYQHPHGACPIDTSEAAPQSSNTSTRTSAWLPGSATLHQMKGRRGFGSQ